MEILMNGKNDPRSQRPRQALGDAFVELLMERGYEGISIKDVLDRANVGRSTFYSHYADKDELFAGQLDR
jgi:AcrR family transcriptional regulator